MVNPIKEEPDQITPPPAVLEAVRKKFDRDDIDVVPVSEIRDLELLNKARALKLKTSWGVRLIEKREVFYPDTDHDNPPKEPCEIIVLFDDVYPQIYIQQVYAISTGILGTRLGVRRRKDLIPALSWGCVEHNQIGILPSLSYDFTSSLNHHLKEGHSNPKSP